MSASTGFLVGSMVIGAVSSMQRAESEAAQQDAARAEALYNAKQLEYAAQQAYWERSTAVSQQIDKGLKDIATGRGKMVAAGNVGPSNQAQVIGSAMNLDQDLSAIYYKYTNEAIQKRNAAAIQRYNAKVYKKNRTNALIGGYLDVGTGIANTGLKGYDMGLWGRTGSKGITFDGAVDNTGLYGQWAG